MLSRRFEYRLEHPPATYWPLLSDTARYNEAMGVPRHSIRDRLEPDGRVRFYGSARIGPFDVEWEDLAPNWIRNAWHEHVRVIDGGPLRRLAARLELVEQGGGTLLRYVLEAEPRGMLGRPFCGTLLKRTGAQFAAVVDSVRGFVDGGAERPFRYQPPPPTSGAQKRAAALVAELERTPYGHGLAGRLARHLFEAQEVDLANVRPLALARAWQAPERDCVEVALAAARAGLLEARWQLLCPRCRVAKTHARRLEQLPGEAHCSTCNIRYDRDYARNVELAFGPAPGIRAVERGEFCWLGPMNTPHIAAQLTMQPGETRRIEVPLAAGRYRLRTLEAGPERDFDWPGGGFPALAVGEQEMRAAVEAAPTGEVCNAAGAPRTLILESRDWTRDALSAHRVTTLQAFRDLFSAEVLRPGDDVAIAQVTFMFTDLAGSTALYERLGDAPAYHRVRAHFAELARIVREHDGAIVKTRGDGVHAAFAEAGAAMRAALAIQVRLAAADADDALHGIAVRIGLHAGPSIAVTIDGRLDYYGTTVNTAARLEGQGAGGDIVLSESLARDPEVASLLEGLAPERRCVRLRGLAEEQPLLRLAPPQVAAAAGRLAAGASDESG